ncbi:hypothetical protein BJX70DRAFT_380024 [Aspergillus crustosus]
MHSTPEHLEKGDQHLDADIDSRIYRTEAYSSCGTSSGDVDRMSQTQTAQTQLGYGLERRQIATQRSQHSATVGALRSRQQLHCPTLVHISQDIPPYFQRGRSMWLNSPD